MIDTDRARKRIRHELVEMDVGTKDIAKLSGLRQSTVTHIIRTGATASYSATVAKMFGAIGLSADFVLFGERKETKLPGRTLGERIKAAANERGYSPEYLSKKSGVCCETIRLVTLGEIDLRMTNLIAIAVALGVSVDWLIGLGNNHER